MKFDFNNPAIIIGGVLVGVILFNLVLFSVARRMSKKQHSHPLQALSKTLSSYGKNQTGYAKDAEELSELLQKINQEKGNGAETE